MKRKKIPKFEGNITEKPPPTPVHYLAVELRNEVTITHATATVTIKTSRELEVAIQEAERMISRVKTKVPGIDNYV